MPFASERYSLIMADQHYHLGQLIGHQNHVRLDFPLRLAVNKAAFGLVYPKTFGYFDVMAQFLFLASQFSGLQL